MKLIYLQRAVKGVIHDYFVTKMGFHWLGGIIFRFRPVQWMFEHTFSRARKFPLRVLIETTNFCNAHCSMCPHDDMTRSKGFMEMQLFKKIVDECASNR